jgi:hypothetical protein
MSLYLFSRPIRTGKTTELLRYCQQNPQSQALLMPDLPEGRHFLFYPENQTFPAFFQEGEKAEKIEIGRFSFSAFAFERANKFLEKQAKNLPALFAIDELGKLEIKGKGLFRGIQACLAAQQKQSKESTDLILVVREELAEIAKAVFQIQDALCISDLNIGKSPSPKMESQNPAKP